MPHIRFNWVDILFVTLLIRISYIGFKNGLLPEFFRLLGLIGAFLFSFNNYTLISDFLSTHTKLTGVHSGVIAFVFIFVFILFIFKILALVGHLFLGFKILALVGHLFLSGENISGFNRLLGFTLGIGRGVLLTSLIYILFVNSPFEYLSKSAESGSFSGRYLSYVAPFVYRIGINCYPGKKIDTPLVRLLEK